MDHLYLDKMIKMYIHLNLRSIANIYLSKIHFNYIILANTNSSNVV